MGDASDAAEVEAFMCSPAGRWRLRALRKLLLHKVIASIEFSNETWVIGLDLRLFDGTPLKVWLPQFDLAVIREMRESLEHEARTRSQDEEGDTNRV